jgi:hypothetical protein
MAHIGARVDLSRWPRSLLTPQVMRAIGQAVATQMAQRAFREGRGLDDRGHRAYATEPLTVYFASETARRLRPKGGAPWHARRGPRAAQGRRGQVIGRRYDGGYGEYKRASRKGVAAGGIEVDLTLSGQLARSLDVTSVTRTRCVVTVRGAAVTYASGVDARRPWFGLSRRDYPLVEATAEELIRAHVTGQTQ